MRLCSLSLRGGTTAFPEFFGEAIYPAGFTSERLLQPEKNWLRNDDLSVAVADEKPAS